MLFHVIVGLCSIAFPYRVVRTFEERKHMWKRVTGFTIALAGLIIGSPAMASIHAGDELTVTVFDHPELSGPIAVDSTDHISMPLVGAVDVRGLSAKQIALRVETSLRRYVNRPAVNVQLKTQVPLIFVAGGPGGTLVYAPGETLVGALGTLAPRLLDPTKDLVGTANAGGSFSDLERSPLDLRHVGVIRDSASLGIFDAEQLFAKGLRGPELQAGDTLTISNKPVQIRVDGAVAKPGFAFLNRDEPLADAFAQVGGLSAFAATARIMIVGTSAPKLLAQGDPRFFDAADDTTRIVVPFAPRVNVAGMVTNPGPIVLKTDTTLLTALYQVGGPQKYADLKHVQVMQNGAMVSYDVTKLVHGDITQNPQLRDGDTVFVPEGHKVDPNILNQILNPLFLLRVLK